MSNGPRDVAEIPDIPDWNRLLDGRVAVVTGGGDGIGEAIAVLFAAHGAAVEVAEIDPVRAERISRDVSAAGGAIRSHVGDVTDDAAELAAARSSTSTPWKACVASRAIRYTAR